MFKRLWNRIKLEAEGFCAAVQMMCLLIYFMMPMITLFVLVIGLPIALVLAGIGIGIAVGEANAQPPK